ncbi:hypothetical protein SKAU_G00275770 [Synaphobranchus kaupii]|uniref:Uncharacterized protein n=1 Tax=Synaphobranchus kaupii TaxID=118154 RepID=A0A9Q1IP10_SYNKA|nr:hypothetical protein SKAU_G00275770 [Synaphobranchus kaupii]
MSFAYPAEVTSETGRKKYKQKILREFPETLKADIFILNDKETKADLLFYTEHPNAWHTALCLANKQLKMAAPRTPQTPRTPGFVQRIQDCLSLLEVEITEFKENKLQESDTIQQLKEELRLFKEETKLTIRELGLCQNIRKKHQRYSARQEPTHSPPQPGTTGHLPPNNRDECSAQDDPAQQSLCQDDPTQRSSAQRSPTQDDPAQRSPIQDDPAQRRPTQDDPAQRSPAQRSPTQDDPAQRRPTQDDPAQWNPTQDDPAQRSPAQRSPTQDDPAQRSPAQRSPLQQDPVQQHFLQLPPAE